MKKIVLLCTILGLAQPLSAIPTNIVYDPKITTIDARIATINDGTTITSDGKSATSLGSEKQLLLTNINNEMALNFDLGLGDPYKVTVNISKEVTSQFTGTMNIFTTKINVGINGTKKIGYAQGDPQLTTKYIFTKQMGSNTLRLIIYLTPNGDKYILNVLYGFVGQFDERAAGGSTFMHSW